jgi:hypothetical protein
MQRFNVNTKKTYSKNGEEKTVWNTVGTITQFDNGDFALELSMFPDTKYYVFPQKEKGEQQPVSPVQEEIKVSDIPF